MKLLEPATAKLQCPYCKNDLQIKGEILECSNCQKTFPIVDGVPILINEENSVFTTEEIINAGKTIDDGMPQRLKKIVKKCIPPISANWVAQANYKEFRKLLFENTSSPAVLVLGSGEKGVGIEVLDHDIGLIDIVYTDVYLNESIVLVCDVHDIPYEDRFFDGVVIQAVLEHVVDPQRCVSELYRVLKPDGLIYAETPFMQPVHMGRHDFTRYTHLGHRRLFRHFSEIKSGIIGGPGMALAVTYQYFLASFFNNRLLRGVAKAFASITSFWLKYFDKYWPDNSPAIDAATGHYFLGRKTDTMLPDRDLLKLYRGRS